jgi:hypothetical protein
MGDRSRQLIDNIFHIFNYNPGDREFEEYFVNNPTSLKTITVEESYKEDFETFLQNTRNFDTQLARARNKEYYLLKFEMIVNEGTALRVQCYIEGSELVIDFRNVTGFKPEGCFLNLNEPYETVLQSVITNILEIIRKHNIPPMDLGKPALPQVKRAYTFESITVIPDLHEPEIEKKLLENIRLLIVGVEAIPSTFVSKSQLNKATQTKLDLFKTDITSSQITEKRIPKRFRNEERTELRCGLVTSDIVCFIHVWGDQGKVKCLHFKPHTGMEIPKTKSLKYVNLAEEYPTLFEKVFNIFLDNIDDNIAISRNQLLWTTLHRFIDLAMIMSENSAKIKM